MVSRKNNAALRLRFIVVKCDIIQTDGVGVGREKGQDKEQCNSADELCYSSRVATCHRNRKGCGNYSYLYEFVKQYSTIANSSNADISYELHYMFGHLRCRSGEERINI